MTTTVSFIMAARNAEAFIGEALASIPAALSGSGLGHEVVVADGRSSDATLTIARQYPAVRIVSESDAGIYDGMNKALAAAKGEVLLILNSDDLLLAGSLTRLMKALGSNPGAPYATGAAEVREADGSVTLLTNRRRLSPAGILFGVPAINARLIRRDWFSRLGYFRTDAGLGADRELLLRAVRQGARGARVSEPVYAYRSHAGSQTLSADEAGRIRIYRSDFELAEALLADPAIENRERATVRAFQALAALKARRIAAQTAGQIAVPSRVRRADTLRGLAHYARWRGVMSGY